MTPSSITGPERKGFESSGTNLRLPTAFEFPRGTGKWRVLQDREQQDIIGGGLRYLRILYSKVSLWACKDDCLELISTNDSHFRGDLALDRIPHVRTLIHRGASLKVLDQGLRCGGIALVCVSESGYTRFVYLAREPHLSALDDTALSQLGSELSSLMPRSRPSTIDD
jgi:hypothetical protein